MKWSWFLVMVWVSLLTGCKNKTPVAPARLPQPPTVAARLADAVLVWIRPEAGPEPGDSPEKGVWNDHLPARTFWITPVGNTWTIVAVRPGLFVAAGTDLLEVEWSRFRYQLKELPAQTEGENAGLAHCRDVFDGWSEVDLNARGAGLVLRDPAAKTDIEVIQVPESIEALDYNASTVRVADVLGGLGNYMFVQVLGHEASCGTGPDPIAEFHIVDLDARQVVTQDFLEPTENGPWVRYFDLPQRRQELAPSLKNQLKEHDSSLKYDPKDLAFFSMRPVFPAQLATVVFQVTYRYWAGCHACPQLDGQALVETLPPELAAYTDRHPALALVDGRLPEGWRIGGFSLLSAPPARVVQLRGHFDATDDGK